MSAPQPILGLVPARGGSKGLPGKNLRPLAGLPLVAHSILCAKMLGAAIDRLIVSTDSEEIAAVGRKYGAEVPFLRPVELAGDATPMLDVVQHAVREMEKIAGKRYGSVLLLDPTSPARYASDVLSAIEKLEKTPSADGVIGVSEPVFNPYWHCVIEKEGFMEPLIPGADKYTRRQEVPHVYRINASLYLWRRDFILNAKGNWMNGRFVMQEIPEERAVHIDYAPEFEKLDLYVKNGMIKLPWLENA